MGTDAIIVSDTSAEVVETEEYTVIVTSDEIATTIEVRSEGPQGPPSFADAPSDGKLYGRRDGAWVEIILP